jgi:uncharacterized protein DUF4304
VNLGERKTAVQKALRSVVGRRLRARGFVGSFPTYRRLRRSQIDIIHFQFAWGTSFRLDAGVVPPRRSLATRTPQQDWAVMANPSLKVRPKKRSVLGKVTRYRPGGDFFSFDNIAPSSFPKLAAVVASVIEEVGERFFG